MTPRRGYLVLCAAALLLARPGPLSSSERAVEVEMRNVRLHVADGIALDVTRLRGAMVSRKAGGHPVFDDQRSYVLHLRTADLSMDMASLETLLNAHVFAFDGAPLKEVAVRADGPRLMLKGTLHKGIDLPFSTTASLSATADGRMRLHVESMKALGVPAKGLLRLFGLQLADLLDLQARRGVDVQENDIVLAPGEVLPPPAIAGRLARVALRGGRLLQVFDDPRAGRQARLVLPSPSARNYVYFGGGTITFGKLTMRDADLQLIDADPRDPFDFFPARYDAQLVAGYSRNTPSGGLRTYMPDFDDLGSRGAGSLARPRAPRGQVSR